MVDGELSGDEDQGVVVQCGDAVVDDLSGVGAHVVDPDLGHEKGSFFFDC